MSTQTSMRDALYEAPGPRTRRAIAWGTAASLVGVGVLVWLVIRRFWEHGQFAPRYWSFFLRPTTWAFLGRGFLGTVEVALAAGAIAFFLGLLLMLGRVGRNRVVSAVCRVLTDLFRSLPSLLLIYFFFLVIPKYGLHLPAFWMITLPVGLAASGVLAEVFRAGVNAVPRGQTEAALSLGMSEAKVMWKIVLPQALRIVIPSLISQLVVVVKDTSVAYVVSFPDLMQNARVLISNYDALVSTYFVVAVIYVLVNYGLNQLAIYVARRSGTRIISRTEEAPV